MFSFRSRPNSPHAGAIASAPLASLLVLALICSTGKSALAAGTPATQTAASTDVHDRVVELVTESAEHYEAGRFQRAVDLLKQAFALEASATIQYNLARAYEGLGDTGGAIGAYRHYLELAPAAQDRGAVERRISVLEHQVEEREALRQRAARAETAPPATSPITDPDADSGPVWLPWGFAALGMALIGVGVGFGLKSQALHADAQGAEYAADAADTNRNAQTYATLANVAFVAGGALTLGGVTWGLFALPTDSTANASAGSQFAGAGFELRGAF